MDELLKQITVPDGIGATITSALVGVIGYLLKRIVQMERVEQEKARLARNQNFILGAILDLQEIALRNGKSPEQREDEMLAITKRLRDQLRGED